MDKFDVQSPFTILYFEVRTFSFTYNSDSYDVLPNQLRRNDARYQDSEIIFEGSETILKEFSKYVVAKNQDI